VLYESNHFFSVLIIRSESWLKLKSCNFRKCCQGNFICDRLLRLNKRDDVIEWKLPPPEMKSWLRPWLWSFWCNISCYLYDAKNKKWCLADNLLSKTLLWMPLWLQKMTHTSLCQLCCAGLRLTLCCFFNLGNFA